jgi:hypothetical protein
LGYDWRGILAVDYAFAAHPYLGESHRIALRFTPSFPRFEGRGYRPGASATVSPERLRPTYPSPYTPGAPGESSSTSENIPGQAGSAAPESTQTPAPSPTPSEILEDGEILEN